MAPLRCTAKFDPFLSLDCAPLDCAPTPSTLAQSKERKGSNFANWQPCFRKFTFAKRPGQYVLEGGCVEEVHDFFLRERLLHHEAEEDDVAELTEVVEQLCSGVGVLHDVLQGGLVVAEDP